MSEMLDDRASRIPRLALPGSRIARLRAGLLPTLLAFCAACAPETQAATRKAAPPPLADFTELSGARAAACTAPGDSTPPNMGEPTSRRCAWSQHIEMLYWQDLPAAGNACLPAPAIAWHHLGNAAHAAVPAWNDGWRGQSLSVTKVGMQQAGALWRRTDGQWSAVLWRWRPSVRPATRNWQAARWDKVMAGVRAIGAANAMPPLSPLMTAWLAASNGKPRLAGPEGARWISGGACLDLRTAGIGKSQLHLPYLRDDARLEQRSAMQVQLARRYPAAQWLLPFTLLEPAAPGARSGAKFGAVWREGALLHGQLWITLRDDAGIVRARVSNALPGTAPAPDLIKERAALIEREITALAHAWEARNE